MRLRIVLGPDFQLGHPEIAEDGRHLVEVRLGLLVDGGLVLINVG